MHVVKCNLGKTASNFSRQAIYMLHMNIIMNAMQFNSKHMAKLNCLCICQVTVGTNPISVAAPGKDGDSFVLDMATSAVALGKVSVETDKKKFPSEEKLM